MLRHANWLLLALHIFSLMLYFNLLGAKVSYSTVCCQELIYNRYIALQQCEEVKEFPPLNKRRLDLQVSVSFVQKLQEIIKI